MADSAVDYSLEGGNFGNVTLDGPKVSFVSATKAGKTIFNIKLDQVAQCVIPSNSKDEIEFQFIEKDSRDRNEDILAQATFHFPAKSVGGEDEEQTVAEEFQKRIMGTGVIKSITGKIIAEFSKEQGNFVTPRGKYGLQLTENHLHMQGAQYSYKIKYDDINSLFLLPKLDGGRVAFVISLEKPIRQGNQKYQSLVLETHKLEQTISIDLTEEEIKEKYDGQLSPEMTSPLSNLIAKVFKVLSQKKVFVPKQFVSARDAFAVRCSLKANEGLLYPLAKALIFINKPTVIIKFDDIDHVEFQRYEAASNYSTRNFDLVISLKNNSEAQEYKFSSIDRSEYKNLYDYIDSKEIKIENAEDPNAAGYSKGVLGGLLDTVDDGEDEEEEDDDYVSGASSKSGDDSGSDGSGSDEDEPEVEKEPKKKRKKTESKAAAPRKKKAKKVKDKNAPKGAMSSYFFFSNAERVKIKEKNPSMSVTDISKEIGAMWKTLSSEEKVPYEQMAKEDKERYAREMAAYKEKSSATVDDDIDRLMADDDLE